MVDTRIVMAVGVMAALWAAIFALRLIVAVVADRPALRLLAAAEVGAASVDEIAWRARDEIRRLVESARSPSPLS